MPGVQNELKRSAVDEVKDSVTLLKRSNSFKSIPASSNSIPESITGTKSVPILVTPPTTPPSNESNRGTIIDIRKESATSNTTESLTNLIVSHFTKKSVILPKETQKLLSIQESEPIRSLPTLILYDDEGLRIYDKITYLDEYYLFNAEKDIFLRKADEIVSSCVEDGGILVELGVG